MPLPPASSRELRRDARDRLQVRQPHGLVDCRFRVMVTARELMRALHRGHAPAQRFRSPAPSQPAFADRQRAATQACFHGWDVVRVIDSSSTPRTANSSAPNGSPASPPQTPTQRPCSVRLPPWRGSRAARPDQAVGSAASSDSGGSIRHTYWVRSLYDREEVGVAGQHIALRRSGRHFDHDADRYPGRRQCCALALADGTQCDQLAHRGDHREHDGQARAVFRRAVQRTQLRFQQVRPAQQKARAAHAQERVFHMRQLQVRHLLVATDIERTARSVGGRRVPLASPHTWCTAHPRWAFCHVQGTGIRLRIRPTPSAPCSSAAAPARAG